MDESAFGWVSDRCFVNSGTGLSRDRLEEALGSEAIAADGSMSGPELCMRLGPYYANYTVGSVALRRQAEARGYERRQAHAIVNRYPGLLLIDDEPRTKCAHRDEFDGYLTTYQKVSHDRRTANLMARRDNA